MCHVLVKLTFKKLTKTVLTVNDNKTTTIQHITLPIRFSPGILEAYKHDHSLVKIGVSLATIKQLLDVGTEVQELLRAGFRLPRYRSAVLSTRYTYRSVVLKTRYSSGALS